MSKEHKFFSEEALKRATYGWHTKIWLWILPTHICIQDNFVVFFKRWRSKFYLMKIKKYNPQK